MIRTSDGILLKPTLCPACAVPVRIHTQLFPVDHPPDIKIELGQIYHGQPGVRAVYCPQCSQMGTFEERKV